MCCAPLPGDLPNPGTEPSSPSLQVDSLPSEPPGKPKDTGMGNLSLLQGNFLSQELNWCLLPCHGKESACNVGDPRSTPGLGRSPGEGNGNPLQYSWLENPMDRGAWRTTVHSIAKSWTWLSNFTFTFSCIPGLDESQTGMKIAERNIKSLRYADDTTLMAQSQEELKSLLMRVKEESEKVGLKLSI